MDEYIYKTELHCHTSYVSRFCATVDAKSIVEQYLEYGYSSIVITDHLNERTFTHPAAEGLSMRERMEYYINGYKKVKEYAKDTLNVLLGAEICFPQNNSDYLIYGPTEDFFLDNPDMYLHDRYWTGSLVHNNGCLFIQAHPFRVGCAVTEDWVIDGIEVFNGHPGQKNHNSIAEEWAKLYPGYILTSGTDHHEEPMFPDSGILTKEPITDNRRLVEVLKSRDYKLIRDRDTREKAREALLRSSEREN